MALLVSTDSAMIGPTERLCPEDSRTWTILDGWLSVLTVTITVMTYIRCDPSDPPMVGVQVEPGLWCDGHVLAQEQQPDGSWRVHVQYRRDGGNYQAPSMRPTSGPMRRTGRGVGGRPA